MIDVMVQHLVPFVFQTLIYTSLFNAQTGAHRAQSSAHILTTLLGWTHTKSDSAFEHYKKQKLVGGYINTHISDQEARHTDEARIIRHEYTEPSTEECLSGCFHTKGKVHMSFSGINECIQHISSLSVRHMERKANNHNVAPHDRN